MKTDAPQQVHAGGLLVDVECPQCGITATVGLHVGGVLKRTDDASTLGLRSQSRPVDHFCGQAQIMVNAATGEVIA